MYFKIDNKEKGKKFTFFKKAREVNGVKVDYTDKTVFGLLSDGIKTGEVKGKATWDNDYWNVAFCGKAYEKALTLHNKAQISVTELSIRNIYSTKTKKSYPQITVTEFDIINNGTPAENAGETENTGDGFYNVPDDLGDETPFS